MSRARLLAVEVERFKSYKEATRAEFGALTVLMGRNNSGKSTLIQALMLLKQTLAHPRPEVQLHLEGPVDALHLGELTHGWKEPDCGLPGPGISVKWQSTIDLMAALEASRNPDLAHLLKWTGLDYQHRNKETQVVVETELSVQTVLQRDRQLQQIDLSSTHNGTAAGARFEFNEKGDWTFSWKTADADWKKCQKLSVELDHFIPYVSINRSNVGPRDSQRAFHNAFLFMFAQPLETLKFLLKNLQYLGSTRELPPSLYRPSSTPPDEIGVSAEYAAQLIHSRQNDIVHFLPPIQVEGNTLQIPSKVRAVELVAAVNEVLVGLGIKTSLRVEDIKDVGFRLLFGNASIAHVGRGLTYLLPIVELGLLADPVRFNGNNSDQELDAYLESCASYSHIAIEEPEAHLHPKVQTRLAHWFVALAMSSRQLIIETHSDHFVRRLRGLAARADKGSSLEEWLQHEVVILETEQGPEGVTRLTPTRLTGDGDLSEHWPADFMDEASQEESAIYYAALEKESVGELNANSKLVHDQGEEPELDTAP